MVTDCISVQVLNQSRFLDAYLGIVPSYASIPTSFIGE